MRTQIIFAALVVFSSATLARAAGIVNGDFETGDFTGWEVDSHSPDPTVLYTGTGDNSIQSGGPSPSGFYGRLKLHSGSWIDQMIYSPPYPYTSTSTSADISPFFAQTFVANAGSILSFDVKWDVTFTGTGPAGFGVTLVGPSGMEFKYDKLSGDYPIAFGDPPHSDWQNVSHTLEHSGEYSIRFSVVSAFNRGAGVSSSSTIELGVDNVTLTPVPEPSTLMMALGGVAIGLAVIVCRRRRRYT